MGISRTALIALLATALAVVLADCAIAQGCAMCKTAVGGPVDPLSNGINTSILFMMAMPFVLFGAVGGWLTFVFWRHRGKKLELELLHTEREGAR